MNRAFSSSSKFKKVTHVIFDMDGVILDTERLYTQATKNVLEKFGTTYDWSIKLKVMGLTGQEAAKRMVELCQLPITWEEYFDLSQAEYALVLKEAEVIPDSEIVYKNVISNIAKAYGKTYTAAVQGKVIGTVEQESARIAVQEMKLPITAENFLIQFRNGANKFLHNVPLIPGARTLINHLYKHNVPIAVATSSSEKSFKLKTEKHKDFFNQFNHIVCGGSDPEVKNGKPAPDVFLICASRFKDKPRPDECLVFEDAPNGVTAALDAGMQVVMVPDENVPQELRKDAHVAVKSLDTVDLSLFGLPPLK